MTGSRSLTTKRWSTLRSFFFFVWWWNNLRQLKTQDICSCCPDLVLEPIGRTRKLSSGFKQTKKKPVQLLLLLLDDLVCGFLEYQEPTTTSQESAVGDQISIYSERRGSNAARLSPCVEERAGRLYKKATSAGGDQQLVTNSETDNSTCRRGLPSKSSSTFYSDLIWSTDSFIIQRLLPTAAAAISGCFINRWFSWLSAAWWSSPGQTCWTVAITRMITITITTTLTIIHMITLMIIRTITLTRLKQKRPLLKRPVMSTMADDS